MKKWILAVFLFLGLIGFKSYAYGFGPGISKNHARPSLGSKEQKSSKKTTVFISDRIEKKFI